MLYRHCAYFRTCLHKKCVRIFEHNFVADKAKIRRHAVARQGFLTQSAAKFAEKTCAYACEDWFSMRGRYPWNGEDQGASKYKKTSSKQKRRLPCYTTVLRFWICCRIFSVLKKIALKISPTAYIIKILP